MKEEGRRDGKKERGEGKQLEKVSVIMGLLVSIITICYYIVMIVINLSVQAGASVEAPTLLVASDTEEHAGEHFISYRISTEPSVSPAKLSVEPYILISFNGRHIGVVHLKNLYTQQAYVENPEGVFPLLKREAGKDICDEIRNGIMEYLVDENGRSGLSVTEETLLGLGFSDGSKEMECRYFLLNGGVPLYLDREREEEILALINREEDEPFEINVAETNTQDYEDMAERFARRLPVGA